MTLRQSLLRGGITIGIGQVIGQGLSVIRNVIVARIISPADFGVASTFVITVWLLELLSDLNIGALQIQAKEGDEPNFQNTAHSLSTLRGLANGIALLLLADPISRLFGVPNARWAFQCLAIYPLLKGLAHLDPNRVQRQMIFAPSVIIETASQFIAAALAWPLTRWLQDYSALLWLLLLQRIVATIGSFLVAQRPFAFAWNRPYLRLMLDFGWPLLLNGVLMFAVFQGDRSIIGIAPRLFKNAHYTLADLGTYSAAIGLSFVAVAVLTRIATSLLFPALARTQNIPDDFIHCYALGNQILSLIAAVMAFLFITAGDTLILLFYGQRYALASLYVGWLGAAQAIRIIRLGPTAAALAKGDPHNTLLSNLARVLGFFAAIAFAAAGANLIWLAIAGLVGEVLGLLVSTWRLQKTYALSPSLTYTPAALAGSAMLAAFLLVFAGVRNLNLLAHLSICLVSLLALLVCWLIAMPLLRHELFSTARSFRSLIRSSHYSPAPQPQTAILDETA